MVAYEFYWRSTKGKGHLIGILPERRRIPERITKDSIVKWGRIAIGQRSGINLKNLYFNQVNYE